MERLKSFGPTTAAALVAGMIGAVIVGGVQSKKTSIATTPQAGSASVEVAKPSPCSDFAGTYPQLADVPTIDGCRLVMAERPMSLAECGAERSSVLVRTMPGDRLLVIQCALAGDTQ